MKKMAKVFKRIPRIMFAFTMIFFMLLSYITPIMNVFAIDNNVTFIISVANTSDATLYARDAGNIVAAQSTGHDLIARRDGKDSIIDFEDTFNNEHYLANSVDVVCSDDKNCVVTVKVPEDHGVRVVTGGDSPIAFKKGTNEYDASPLANNDIITVINRNIASQTPFTGSAYLVWSCNEGTCYKLIENLSNTVSFIKAESIKSETDGTTVFDTSTTKKGFVLPGDFTEWQTYYKTFKNLQTIDWSKLDAGLILYQADINIRVYEEKALESGKCTKEGKSREEFEECVDGYIEEQGIFNHPVGLKPVGEPYSVNAFVSYGDRNFKAIIYNTQYKAVTIGSLSELSYYPSIWTDELIRIDAYDISATTKDNPAQINAVILEPTINIRALNNYNNLNITKIEALDIPENAVDIKLVNGEYKITFSSNFYDKVVFKITDDAGKEYFIRINRFTLELDRDEVRWRDGETHDVDIKTNFYFDRNTSYKDYLLTAKVKYKDGSSKIIEMTNAKEIDNGMGDKVYTYEIDDQVNPTGPHNGKGLKLSTYKVTFTMEEVKKIDKVYLNVEFKGSTQNLYAGAFAGSGNGVVINFVEDTNHD